MSESTGINNKHRIKQFILSTRKIVFIYVIILFVFVLFQNQIDKAFIKLDLLNLNYGVDLLKVIYAILVIGLSIKAYTNIRSKQIKTLFINSLCITFIYSLYRNNIIAHTQWKFVPLYDSFNYADVIYWVPCIMILKWLVIKYKTNKAKLLRNLKAILYKSNRSLREWYKKKTQKVAPNPADPITCKEHDKFGYSKDTKQLLKKILDSQSMYKNSSFVIGLKGEWGLGKTSYLNLLEESCQSESKVKVIRFNPWYSTGYNQMVSNFFNSFNTAIEDSSLSQQLEHYSQSLANANLGWFSTCLKVILNKPTVSFENQHKEINARIQKTEKIYLVLIDDMDRLDKDEILNVIKLIRNAANFCKTVFIIAYDQQYVNNALSEAKLRDPEKYMEKIITCPYNLPLINEEKRIQTIKGHMTSILSFSTERKDEYIKEHINAFLGIIENNITLRNAVRLAHSVASNVGNLKDGKDEYVIYLSDYLAINYVSIIAYEAYKNIENTSNILTRDFSPFRPENLIISSEGFIQKNLNTDPLGRKAKITDNEYQEKTLTPLVKRPQDIVVVHKIINSIFTKTTGIYRISQPEAFYLYFERKINKDVITPHEFDEMLELNSKERKEKLTEWQETKERVFIFTMFKYMTCKSEKEWVSIFKDITVYYPKSITYQEYLKPNPSIQYNIILPGNSLLNIDSREEQGIKTQTYKEAIKTYLTNIKDDNIEDLSAKIILLENNHLLLPLINDMTAKSTEKLNIIYNILKCYLELIDDYTKFNDLAWAVHKQLKTEQRTKIRELYRKHIKEHITSFLSYYNKEKLENSKIRYLFDFDDDNIDNPSVDARKVWGPNFKAFLDEIPNKTKEQEKWIKELEL